MRHRLSFRDPAFLASLSAGAGGGGGGGGALDAADITFTPDSDPLVYYLAGIDVVINVDPASPHPVLFDGEVQRYHGGAWDTDYTFSEASPKTVHVSFPSPALDERARIKVKASKTGYTDSDYAYSGEYQGITP